MIESHELEAGVGRKIYAEPVTSLDYTTRFMLDNYSKMIELLDRMANYSDRQRESATQEVIDLSPSAGQQTPNTYNTRTGLRITGFLLSSGTATDQFQLAVGSRTFRFFAGAIPVWLPFPISVQHGIDLSITDLTTPGATNWSAYIFAYPMET